MARVTKRTGTQNADPQPAKRPRSKTMDANTLELSADDRKLLEAIKKEQVEKIVKAQDNAAKHEHALVKTMEYDAVKRKMVCKIRCTECGDENRVVATSDLHTVHTCVACTGKALAKKKEHAKVLRAKVAQILKDEKAQAKIGDVTTIEAKADEEEIDEEELAAKIEEEVGA